jgi:hypothetical protein
MTHRVLLLIIASAWVPGGCKPPERDRCLVQGTARMNGQSLGGFQISLYSESVGGGGGEVNPDGTFRIFGPMQEGEYTVYFVISEDTKGAAREKLQAMGVPMKYRRAETSDYKVTLAPGQNHFDIDLKP